MINFSTLKDLTIPEGRVTEISVNNTMIWRAISEVVSDGITYKLYDSKAEVIACDNELSGNVLIPKEVNGRVVTTIRSQAFSNCTKLTSVIIPDSVTFIGESAFYKCTSLASVTIPDSVRAIEIATFYHCRKLTSVTIPDSVRTIGRSAFYNCSGLTSVTIGNSVRTIGTTAFSHCINLTSVTIPNNVTRIEEQAFYYCSDLQNVVFENKTNWYSESDSGVRTPIDVTDSARNASILKDSTGELWVTQ